MSRHHSPVDHRPFQSKAKLEKQQALVARYGVIALPELAEAIGVVAKDDAAMAETSDGVAKAA